MKKHFVTIAKISLILVYLVIVAGALVRMTGSGMGCPDWPKCFGYYIPPTELKELLFTANKEYTKGQVIILDETLFVAKKDFTSSTTYQATDWEKYTKHDYAIFNPMHTWIEYINRLLGALAGLACFITFLVSFYYWKERKLFVFFSLGICVLMGFQAWLGKTVVDSELSPYKITTHMLVAFLIVAMQLYLIFKATTKITSSKIDNPLFKKVIVVALGLTIIQVVLGTTVREFIDHMQEAGLEKMMWLQSPEVSFYVHRSFSIAVLLLNIYLFYSNRKLNLGFSKINWVMLIIGFEILSGVIMANFYFPFGSQTIHLILAALLFGVQFYLVLENYAKKTRN
ncbi:COX15/CtaA family protein [Flavobacterium sp. j3]|uniref:COX15/CtaA family protein n=1 Tax=Flavobacterium aureirubrum TaxID=3133147 RepID=A0ABU9N5P2_9FLAO